MWVLFTGRTQADAMEEMVEGNVSGGIQCVLAAKQCTLRLVPGGWMYLVEIG
jgi:hypothetical protein